MPNKSEMNRRDYVTNKVLLVFTLALVGVLSLMFIYRLLNYGSTFMMGYTILRVSGILSVPGMALGIVLWLYERRTGKNTEFKMIKGANILFFFLACGVCVAFILKFDYITAIKVLYVLIPASAVIYLIFYVYQPEFFIITLVSCVGGIGLWAMHRAMSGLYAAYAPVIFALIVLFSIGASALTFGLMRNKGLLKIGKKSYEVFERNSRSSYVYLASAVSTLFSAAALICGATTAYYLMFGIFGYLFIMGIYFTVKLM